jgi:hypothetical protein
MQYMRERCDVKGYDAERSEASPTWQRRRRVPALVLIWLTVSLARSPITALAKEESSHDILEGLLSSFSLPLQDLFIKKRESEWRNLLTGVTVGLAFDYPLNSVSRQAGAGSQSQGERGANGPTVSASLKYNPLSYWFFSTTLYKYLDEHQQASWNPDFTYSFGYNDWHPYTLSLVYANYGGNRFRPEGRLGEKFTRFEEGTWSLGWKLPQPSFMKEALMVHSTSAIDCATNVNATPRYVDLASGTRKNWKQSFSLGCKYTIYKWWYINFILYYYPDIGQQQPWDPDFTYGIGYFDWHPGTISVQYNNYSGNRFPGREKSPDTGRFKDGSITILWSWTW